MVDKVTTTQLRCIGTCYMPSDVEGVMVERYEDEEGEDVYSVLTDRVNEFLATGNFERLEPTVRRRRL